jgi:dTDP-4-dehydrorhamnose 3,5-epimerase-like enzyme
MSVTISTIPIKAEDERGALHYFATDRSGEYLLVYRNKGSISGQHYHKGLHRGKNPEDMLLLSGSIQLDWKDLTNDTSGSDQVNAPSRITISPNVWHQVEAITDIIFIELNSLQEGSEDTYRL